MILPLSYLDTATAQQVASLSPQHLQSLKDLVYAELILNKRRKQILEDGLKLKYFNAAKRALHATLRDTGTTRIKDGPYVIVADIPKKVIWDQDKLIPIVEKIPPDVRLPGLSMAYSIHETHYKTWEPHIQELFRPARTIMIGTPDFKFTEGDLA